MTDIANIPSDDIVLPFQIEPSGLHGRLVRLGPSVDAILRQHDYPPPVALALAETVALSAALAATLKYDGVFTLQIKGDGPVRLMVMPGNPAPGRAVAGRTPLKKEEEVGHA